MDTSSTTPDPGCHMGKWQNKLKHHKQKPKVSPFPAGDHKAAMNRRESMTNTRHKLHKWSTKEVSVSWISYCPFVFGIYMGISMEYSAVLFPPLAVGIFCTLWYLPSHWPPMSMLSSCSLNIYNITQWLLNQDLFLFFWCFSFFFSFFLGGGVLKYIMPIGP